MVPNGDFEQYKGCPSDQSELDSTLFWFNPAIGAQQGTPDYYNQCATGSLLRVPDNQLGYQQAHSGSAYAGIFLLVNAGLNFREYIEVPLLATLTANTTYQFRMYVNLSDRVKWSTDDISVYFSDTAITTTNILPLPFTPQINNVAGNYPDTLNWTLISGTYVAAGGENYLVIGNFYNDSNTNLITVNNALTESCYIYVDDVCVAEDSSTCGVTLVPPPLVEPSNCKVAIPSAFSPNNDGINDIFKPITHCEFTEYNMKIFNRWGEKIFESLSQNNRWDGGYQGEKVDLGVYAYLFRYRIGGLPSIVTSGSVTVVR